MLSGSKGISDSGDGLNSHAGIRTHYEKRNGIRQKGCGMEEIMKKLSVMLGASLLMFALAGCGAEEKENPESESSTVQSSAEESTDNGAQDEGSMESSEGTDFSEEQEESGTVANGYDYANGWTEEMTAIRAAVTEELGDTYWPDTQIYPDFLELSFGLTEEMYEDYMAEMPMISVNVDTLLIVKAKPGQVETVEAALNSYRDAAVSQGIQYPMNVGKVQASVVETIGEYVCFVQLGGDTDAVMEQGDDAVIAQCKEVNERVIEMIRQQIRQPEE